MNAPSHRKGLHVVAAFEAFKGAIVLLAGFGLLTFLGKDAEHLAEQVVYRMHLNPAHHYPQIFLRAMSHITDTKLWMLAGFAMLYSAMRFAEAYGLWRAKRWAEWFAALSGSIYVPAEVYEVVHRPTWIRVAFLIGNLAIVAYMVWLLTEARRLQRADERTRARADLTED